MSVQVKAIILLRCFRVTFQAAETIPFLLCTVAVSNMTVLILSAWCEHTLMDSGEHLPQVMRQMSYASVKQRRKLLLLRKVSLYKMLSSAGARAL